MLLIQPLTLLSPGPSQEHQIGETRLYQAHFGFPEPEVGRSYTAT